MVEQKIDLKKALQVAADQIDKHNHRLAPAQKQFAEAVGDHSVLLVDLTLGDPNPSTRFLLGMKKLHEIGYGEIADLYEHKLFHGKLPQNTFEVFQGFFGDETHLEHAHVSGALPDISDDVGALVFTGSIADVSKALTQPELEVFDGLTHRRVFDWAAAVYRRAVQRQLPVIGICYGHQVVSKMNGGDVIPVRQLIGSRKSVFNVGMRDMETTTYGEDLLDAVLDRPAMNGSLAVYHGDTVIPNAQRSATLFKTACQDKSIVHGLIHVSDGELTGDAGEDAEVIREHFETRRHMALSVQAHPEYTGAERLMTLTEQINLSDFEVPHEDPLTGNMLGLFSRFLAPYCSGEEKQFTDEALAASSVLS